jgi:hypothetical protein
MLNSTVLDVAVGIIFVFLALSLAVSSIVEAIASAVNWRANTLLEGVKQLLNDGQFTGLALNIYNHGLVNPLGTGQASSARALTNMPSYIDPRLFADALLDVTQIAKDTPANIKAAVDSNVTDPQLNSLITGIVARSSGDLTKVRDDISTWFDNSMDRVSGAYKRKTQLWSFLIALAIAALLNVNAIEIGKALWQQPMLAKAIAPISGDTPTNTLKRLEDLPLPMGWTETKLREQLTLGVGFRTFLGCLITALATLFGAPFWFDALQQIVRLKGSGPSPAEKRSGTGAAN